MASKLTGHQESPEITGLLYKKRGGFGKMMPNCWQYRLFILSKEGVLTYYDTEVPENKDIFESKERGRLDLKGVKIELSTDSTEGAPTPFTIVIQPDEGEKWKLCADTKEDHARWWKMIEKFINENSENGRQGHLNIQSDDDNDNHMATPAAKIAKRGSTATRGIEIDQSKIATPMVSAHGSPSFTFESTTPALARPTATAAPASTAAPKKNRLKLTKETAFISQEWIEWALVLTIVNICVCGILRSPEVLDRAVFIVALNVVVAHTLYLRSARSAANTSASAAPASEPAVTITAAATSRPVSTSMEKKTSGTGGSNAKLSASAGGNNNPSLAAPVTNTAAVAPVLPTAEHSVAPVAADSKPISGEHTVFVMRFQIVKGCNHCLKHSYIFKTQLNYNSTL